jgi:hypothetical protein
MFARATASVEALVVERLQDFQLVPVAELYIDNRWVFVLSLLARFAGRLSSVLVVVLGRGPEVVKHFAGASFDFDSGSTEIRNASNKKRASINRCIRRAHLRRRIVPFCEMRDRVGLGNVHASIVGDFQKQLRYSFSLRPAPQKAVHNCTASSDRRNSFVGSFPP